VDKNQDLVPYPGSASRIRNTAIKAKISSHNKKNCLVEEGEVGGRVGEGPVLPPRRIGVAGPGLGSPANGLRILQTEKFSYFTMYLSPVFHVRHATVHAWLLPVECGVRIGGGGGGSFHDGEGGTKG
jgi:hypothetical protein